jgi:DNA gyrase/topoisomerase IV subunit B
MRTDRQQARAAITTDDVMISAGIMLSVFIREPEFVGQTKGQARHCRGPAHCRQGSVATISTTG